jgi:hypothetical protein
VFPGFGRLDITRPGLCRPGPARPLTPGRPGGHRPGAGLPGAGAGADARGRLTAPGRYSGLAQAGAELLSPEAVTRTHQAAHQTIGALLERGRADGSFRTDLSVGWLIARCVALIHACAEGTGQA